MEFIEYSDQIRGWLDQVHMNCGRDAKQVEKYCSMIEEHARIEDDAKLLGFVYFYRSQDAYLSNRVTDLFRYVMAGMEYQERAAQWEYVALSYNLLGITSVNQGNALFAMDYYLNGLSLCERYHLEENAYVINMNIGSLYIRFEEYDRAEQYFKKGLSLFLAQPKTVTFCQEITVIYISLAVCALLKDDIETAAKYVKTVLNKCFLNLDDAARIYVKAFQVKLYHREGKNELRDILIGEISKGVDQMTVTMEWYDDFYAYACFLLDLEKYEEFKYIVAVLESFVNETKINYLQRQIVTLKIRYYKQIGNIEDYQQTSAIYFDLSEILEKENAFMLSSMLNVRTSLEEAKKKGRKMQAENMQLQKKSETDALTGMANRSYLNEYAEKVFQEAYVRKSYLAVEILDIDYFKQYNDNYGHQAGDQCIIAVAQAIKSMEKYGHIFCARYGGDEFVIIYDGYTKEQIEGFAKMMKQKISDCMIAHAYSAAGEKVTISQGFCLGVPSEKQKVWDYLYSADRALYRVKKQNRNHYAISKCEME